MAAAEQRWLISAVWVRLIQLTVQTVIALRPGIGREVANAE
jgi:hypothetical protein